MEYIVEYKKINQTKYINDLILEASTFGGGKLIFKENITYTCGSIILLDNVTLCLEKNSKIIGSSNLDDYLLINNVNNNIDPSLARTYEDCSYNGNPSKCFIYAKNCNNISISGSGTIDGNEKIYYGRTSKYQIEGSFYPRIPLIFFENCKNIHLSNFFIKNSGFWTIHLVGVDGGSIEGLNINNSLRMANCDGIDPDHSKNLIIRNCNISCADDCIVFKNTKANIKYGSCENIEVTGCNLISTSAAIKFGTETCSDFKNINISNCNITDSNRGISIQLRDVGSISDCSFNNINISTRRFEPLMWWGSAEVIAITSIKRDNDTLCGSINNLKFNNINAFSEGGILLYSENMVNNITLTNVNLRMIKKTEYEYKGRDLRPCINNLIIKDNNYALYAKGINNLILNDFNYIIEDNIKYEFKDEVKIIN